MSDADDLQRYLQSARDALVWKLDGLSETTGPAADDTHRHQPPRPGQARRRRRGRLLRQGLRPSRSRSHCRGRTTTPSPTPTCSRHPRSPQRTSSPSTGGSGRTATPRSPTSRWRREGQVPWWPPERREVTLHRIAVHVIADIHRHAGHADILREIDRWRRGSARRQLQPSGSRLDRIPRSSRGGCRLLRRLSPVPVRLLAVRGHLRHWVAEGSIPSPRCRHHVDRHRTTGAAGRRLAGRRKRPPALLDDRRNP